MWVWKMIGAIRNEKHLWKDIFIWDLFLLEKCPNFANNVDDKEVTVFLKKRMNFKNVANSGRPWREKETDGGLTVKLLKIRVFHKVYSP